MQGYKADDRLFSLSSTTSQAVRGGRPPVAASTQAVSMPPTAQRKELEQAQLETLDAGYATHRSSNFLAKARAQSWLHRGRSVQRV